MKDVRVAGDALSVDLMDGRTITVPLAWYPRLAIATPDQLDNWEVAGVGFGIRWPDLDEDLSTEGLLRGAPAPTTGWPRGSDTDAPRPLRVCSLLFAA